MILSMILSDMNFSCIHAYRLCIQNIFHRCHVMPDQRTAGSPLRQRFQVVIAGYALKERTIVICVVW